MNNSDRSFKEMEEIALSEDVKSPKRHSNLASSMVAKYPNCTEKGLVGVMTPFDPLPCFNLPDAINLVRMDTTAGKFHASRLASSMRFVSALWFAS